MDQTYFFLFRAIVHRRNVVISHFESSAVDESPSFSLFEVSAIADSSFQIEFHRPCFVNEWLAERCPIRGPVRHFVVSPSWPCRVSAW